ncbi:cytochrome P450 72A14-like [Salvia splendens]|uniref:cytochrome P450 72A14-like n=1 Tax=Salvia splendens TaxID=180675 RepID=UPI001C27A337|nr:cytochrome P450 72A14-like [Salvia splendens]
MPTSPLNKMLGKGLEMLEQDEWTKHRKLINPAFHVQKLKNMVGSFHMSCSIMLRKWDEIPRIDGSMELDVWPYLQAMTADVVSRAAFRISNDNGEKIARLKKQYMPTKANRRLKQLTEEIKSIFRSIISKRTEEEANRSEEDGNKEAGRLLFKKRHARETEKDSDDHGYWAPELGMILHEVLRLYPPIVMLARHTDKADASGKVTIPAGVQLMLPVLLLHHDVETWGPDAKEFNPERFAQGVSGATKGQLTYLPFRWGPRGCIAQNFGKTLSVHYLKSHFAILGCLLFKESFSLFYN